MALINKPLEYCLKLIGFWPWGLNLFGILTITSIIFSLVPFQCIEVFFSIKNLPLAMDNFSDIIIETLIVIKIFILWKNRRNLNTLLKQIILDWSFPELPEEWKILARYSLIFCSVNVYAYLFASFSYYPDAIISYISQPPNQRKTLLRASYPFNYLNSPAYEIIIIVQMIQGNVLALADSLTQTLLVTLVLHIVAHIEILLKNIKTYSRNFNNELKNNLEKKEYLNIMILQHKKVLNLLKKINGIYSTVSFFQLIFSKFIICLKIFIIITAGSSDSKQLVKYIAMLTAMFGQAFTFCYVGQFLQNKGELIFNAVYECPWHDINRQEVKILRIILQKAIFPLELRGGKFYELSYKSFLQIVKTSFSYLSVLRAINR